MAFLDFKITHSSELARTGVITTSHGQIQTPCFMPVGTRGAVRTLTSPDLEFLNAKIILGNTYHLMLRPGDELIAKQGGLHKFMDWDRPILTDSGGYQILSLKPKIDEEGAVFKSTYDGDLVQLTPEKAVHIQTNLGSDIQMVLDVCPPLPAEPEVIENAVRLTGAWAIRARKAFLEDARTSELAQFGIIQGGLDLELRQKSAEQIQDIGFEGYAIGGLSVGETSLERSSILKSSTQLLDSNSPRYLMGVGDPVSLLEATACGVDMFDCVLPTRLARHGTALTSTGRLNLKAAIYAEDKEPLDPGFPESPANRWPRSYLRHLLAVGEPSVARILTLHNLAWILNLMERAREAISENSLPNLLAEIQKIYEK